MDLNSFGNGYSAKENLQLAEGTYSAVIEKVDVMQSTQKCNSYIKVFFTINGKQGYKPNCKIIFARPSDPNDSKLQEHQDYWDLQMTTFFDAFKIPRGLWESSQWIKKAGIINVVRNKKNPNYMDIYPVVEKKEATSTNNTNLQNVAFNTEPAIEEAEIF